MTTATPSTDDMRVTAYDNAHDELVAVRESISQATTRFLVAVAGGRPDDVAIVGRAGEPDACGVHCGLGERRARRGRAHTGWTVPGNGRHRRADCGGDQLPCGA